MDREFIRQHNARVAAFWDEYRPRIESLGRGELEEAVRLVQVHFLTIRDLGKALRERLPFTWEERHDTAVGLRVYRHALEVLGLYDDDIRPAPDRKRKKRQER